MATVNPYLTFNGECEAAFELYKGVFGAEYKDFNRFKDYPTEPGQELPAGTEEQIMHVSMPISKETILMGSDAHPLYPPITVGQHLSISINTESTEEADRIFAGLSNGGQITMPLEKTFWGAYFGMLTDQFGVMWMVNYDEPKQ
jgi:PhnB protein